MHRYSMTVVSGLLFMLTATISTAQAVCQKDTTQAPLTETGRKLEARYTKQLETLRAELMGKLPNLDQASQKAVDTFLSNDQLDERLVKFVVLHEATPRGLAEFAQRGDREEKLIERLLANSQVMKQMLVADGAKSARDRKNYGPAQYGKAIEIYTSIQQASNKASTGILQRLALATSLEHAVPIDQSNPTADENAPTQVDPVQRYLHFEAAYLNGELDPNFEQLSTWELRMVVNGDEPNETLAWGRKMLRNFRPDHIFNEDDGWRYVSVVGSDVKYGSECVKFDRPELQKYQNIIMNGGVCGRRAFFGRFILRSFGVPTIARPSRGHGALAHWTPAGWVVNLGGGWGAGWTKTLYESDLDFLATTQAREDHEAFLQVKRAQWAGDVLGESRTYGEHDGEPAAWNKIALRTQRSIIENLKSVTLDALGEDLGEANEPTVAEKVKASPVTSEDRQIVHGSDGVILIPAAAYSSPTGNTRDVVAMKSFDGGLQVFLPRFFPQGKTIMRGGTWKGEPDACTSGKRMLSGGYGRYENWGLRAAVSVGSDGALPESIKLRLNNGTTMELVYIKPGSFVMGGESTSDGRFECVEVPKHEVELTRGFYLGKYEVTQAQYEAVMGKNPSKSTRDPNCPVDNVSEADALSFCGKLSEETGLDVRLPTEAEWEYASRAGRDTKWFFGDDPAQLGEYAWFKGNANAKSHAVGLKKPNPWGLYDIYGNVCERISDKYERSYYSKSPRIDPTGPSSGTNSRLEYKVVVPKSGQYALTARLVTVNFDQRLNLAVNRDDSPIVMDLPFTNGEWHDCQPVVLTLKQGENTLRFWRDQPPQYGVAIKEFKLTPVN